MDWSCGVRNIRFLIGATEWKIMRLSWQRQGEANLEVESPVSVSSSTSWL